MTLKQMPDFSLLYVAIDELESAVDDLTLEVIERDRTLSLELDQIDQLQTELADRLAKFTAAAVEAEALDAEESRRDYAEYANDNRMHMRELL